MITRDRFDNLKERYSEFSSWALWVHPEPGEPITARMGDLSALDPDVNSRLLEELNPEVVLLGLNASSRGAEMEREPWRNFHDASGNAKDYKIRFAFRDTPYWGAYMTDVFVDLPETDSRKVARWRAENPDKVAEQLRRLESELDALGSVDPLIVVFGGLAFSSLPRSLRETHRVVQIEHYSNRIGKEDYRAKVLAQLSTANS